MKRYVFAGVFIVIMIMAVCAYATDVMNDLEKSVVRLHIIAQSNSEYDQSIKLEVRNAVLEAVKNTECTTTDDFLQVAESTADRVLKSHGIEYGARAEYGKFYFPEKSYKNIILPEGEYYGIRIILGSGEGENWWCVMYPPLCVADDNSVCLDEKSDIKLKSSVRADTYDVISQNDGKKIVKFRIVEAAQKIIKSVSN